MQPPFAAAGPANAEALRRAHLEQAMAARAAGGGGGGAEGGDSKEARIAAFKALLSDAGVNAFSFFEKVRPKLESDARWQLLPNISVRRSVFEEFCKTVGQQQKTSKAAAEKAAVSGFKALLEEFVALERRVAAELEAAAAQTAAAAAAAMEGEDGEQQEGGEAAAAEPRSPSSIHESELDGLSFEQLETYWSGDDRWTAVATDGQRRSMFEQRFGAVLAAASERREVRLWLGCVGLIGLIEW